MAVIASRNRPTEMAGGFVMVSTGRAHACGLQADGSAFCWGANDKAQLGNGATSATGVSLPVRVATQLRFSAIATGGNHTCAIVRSSTPLDGTAFCWGSNAVGQLGDFPVNFTTAPTPIAVIAPTAGGSVLKFKSIAAGSGHTCAIDAADAVWCWGDNSFSQLGFATTSCTFPTVCSGRPGMTKASAAGASGFALTFRSISAGTSATCGIDSSGAVRCWGQFLTFGAGPTFSPVTAAALSSAVSVSVGDASACAVGSQGQALCWGLNHLGQLGNGAPAIPGAHSSTPVTVSGAQDYVAVTVGGSHACGRTTAGTLRCWGDNSRGELGVGALAATLSNVPRSVDFLSVNSVAAGGLFVCSSDPQGVTACWGDNASGQIGDGKAGTVPLQSVVPTPVPRFGVVGRFGPQIPEALSSTLPQRMNKATVWTATFARLTSGDYHNCVLEVSGRAFCWGFDLTGPIGNGSRTTANCRVAGAPPATCVPAPTIVSRAPGHVFATIAAGRGHNCALNDGRRVFCWGDGDRGQLGSLPLPPACGAAPTSCINRVPTMIQVPFPYRGTMVSLAANTMSTCAVNDAAELFCWGAIGASQTPNPMAFASVPRVRIALGSDFGCQGLMNLAAMCFGGNGSGQLGDGTTTTSATPVFVSTGNYSSLALGWSFGCGLDGGFVTCWGANGEGQLGNGSTVDSASPSTITGALSNAVSTIGAGAAHVCAMNAQGNVSCWGRNANGQLGNGGTAAAPTTTPTSVAGGWLLP